MNGVYQIKEFLGDAWYDLQDIVHNALRSEVSLLEETNNSILEHSGKQLRPLMAILMAKATGSADISNSVRFAAASEILHNATLLHDDVVDESEVRRGQPTVNALLGSTVSVLVGDFWLSKAVDIVINTPGHNVVLPLFNRTLTDLAEGELLQLKKASSADTSIDDYMRIIYCKTASLFETACRSAAMAAGACEQMVEAAGDYARNLGLAFQIKDDIMDYSGSNIGKPIGVDLKERKITLPLLGAFASATPEEEAAIRQMVLQIPDCPDNVQKILSFVESHSGIDYAHKTLIDYTNRAKECLAAFPQVEAREYLSALADYLADRTK